MLIQHVHSDQDFSESVSPALRVTLPALLDLESVAAADRVRLWSACAFRVFPGLSIDRLPFRPTLGTLKHQSLGSGSLSYIQSPPAELHYAPPNPKDGHAGSAFSVTVQLSGELAVSQHGRQCLISPGDVCPIDERFGFRLQTKIPCEMIILRLPRAAVLAHHPHLADHTATALNAGAPGTILLRNTVLNVMQVASHLSHEQGAAAIAGIIQMMGMADFVAVGDCSGASHLRVRSALTFVELSLFDPGLTASAVAADQGISRRHLDTLFLSGIGISVTAYIWSRRLALAASFLRDPRRSDQKVAQIAYAAGFANPEHFTRKFKRRFGCTPGRWRERRAGSAAAP
jgi:AraC-like DNA-binding protein